MKKRLLHIVVISIIFTSCSKQDDIIQPKVLSEFQKETISYFKEIALGFEFGSNTEITRKWTSEMSIFIGGEKKAYLTTELSSVIEEINQLSSDGFSIAITEDSLKSNYYIFLGSGTDYGNQFPSLKELIKNNYGLFTVNWNGKNELFKGKMYVDIYRADQAAQKHLLREELTQSLGLAKDSYLYPESIFQQSWTYTTSFAPIDKELIRLLYHPNVSTGLNAEEITEILTNILLDEN